MTPKPQTSQELQTYRSSDAAALEELKNVILGGDFEVEVIDDPALVSKQILADIFAAESVEDLERKPAEGWRDYAGVPMEILSFTARKSEYDGSAFYFVVRAVDMTDGESHVLTTGSLNVCAQLVKLAQLGEIPGCVRVLHEEQTKGNEKRHVNYLAATPAEQSQWRESRIAERESVG